MDNVISSRANAVPVTEPGRRWWGSKSTFSLVSLAAIAVIIALIVNATLDTGMYYLTVDEYHSRLDTLRGDKVRVSGEVVAASEIWDAQATRLEFRVQDAGGRHDLKVVYYGPRPDNFHRATSAILEGTMAADGTFQADTLLTKCPSRYEEAAPVDGAAP